MSTPRIWGKSMLGPDRIMSNSHFITRCSCGQVIAQCRCIGDKHETVIEHGCDKCKSEMAMLREDYR